MENRINPDDKLVIKHRNKKPWIYLGVIAVLLATNAFLYFNKKNNPPAQDAISQNYSQAVYDKEMLQTEYHAALAHLDELTSHNVKLKTDLENKDSEIAQMKQQIHALLSSPNITSEDLIRARALIAQLKVKVSNYEGQVRQLKKEKKRILVAKDSVLHQNQELNQKVEKGRQLHASNIRMIPISLRKGGRKESVTEKARKVDLLRITFDINENNIIDGGQETFEVRIVNPDGVLLSNPALGSGTFTDHNGSLQNFSVARTVSIDQGLSTKDINIDWQQAASYEKGPYILEIYNNGQLIGQTTAKLK